MMEKKYDFKNFRLLPNKWKTIGILVVISAMLPTLIALLMHLKLNEFQKTIVKQISFDLVILGLLFIVISKEKEEDERIAQMRLKAMAGSFLFITIIVIVDSTIDLLFHDFPSDTVNKIIMLMLVYYLCIFHSLKRRKQ